MRCCPSATEGCVHLGLTRRSQSLSLYFLIRYGLSQINAPDQEQVNRQAAAAAVLRKLDREPSEEDPHSDSRELRHSRKEDLALNQYEQMIAMDVVAPEDIPVTFEGARFISMSINNRTQELTWPCRHWWPW